MIVPTRAAQTKQYQFVIYDTALISHFLVMVLYGLLAMITIPHELTFHIRYPKSLQNWLNIEKGF